MTGRRGRPWSGRCADEDGVILVVCALTMVAMLVMAALVIDIGFARGGARLDQTTADLAALSGGEALGLDDYSGACQSAIENLNRNAKGMPAIGAAAFCGQSGNSVAATTCSGGSLTQARPTVTSGRYTVAVHFPVPDSEIADPAFGTGLNDGVPCERMRVIVSSEEPSFFGGVNGSDPLTVTRSATVQATGSSTRRFPALWLLDPTGCTGLTASGGSQVNVGTATIPGIITVDSDGTTCTGMQTTVSAGGNGTRIYVVPTTVAEAGSINLVALPSGATTCTGRACEPSDVSSGRLNPQPVPAGERATRAPVDWMYNCKAGYPAYHGVPIVDCPEAGTTPAYIDLLRAAVSVSGPPAGYQRWTSAHSCNASTVTVAGNWWVDCPGGLSIGNGATVTFADGNVVFDDGLKMTGGALNINTANGTAHLPGGCLPPAVGTPCIGSASDAAGLVYLRAGDISLTGGVLTINHSAVYLATGVVKVAGGAPPSWTAPTEGPLAGLSLWAEAGGSGFQINGGAGVHLTGTFFTPEANPLTLSGGGNWGQQFAQFISFHLAVSGGGNLSVSPDADHAIPLPPESAVLIR